MGIPSRSSICGHPIGNLHHRWYWDRVGCGLGRKARVEKVERLGLVFTSFRQYLNRQRGLWSIRRVRCMDLRKVESRAHCRPWEDVSHLCVFLALCAHDLSASYLSSVTSNTLPPTTFCITEAKCLVSGSGLKCDINNVRVI